MIRLIALLFVAIATLSSAYLVPLTRMTMMNQNCLNESYSRPRVKSILISRNNSPSNITSKNSTRRRTFREIFTETGNNILVDVRETKEFYEIYADVPGVNKDATKLSIEDHILTISTERNPVKSEEQDSFRRVERFSGTYSRSLRLPDDADEENITASFKDGVMTIRIARIPEDIARGRRTIPVSFE